MDVEWLIHRLTNSNLSRTSGVGVGVECPGRLQSYEFKHLHREVVCVTGVDYPQRPYLKSLAPLLGLAKRLDLGRKVVKVGRCLTGARQDLTMLVNPFSPMVKLTLLSMRHMSPCCRGVPAGVVGTATIAFLRAWMSETGPLPPYTSTKGCKGTGTK